MLYFFFLCKWIFVNASQFLKKRKEKEKKERKKKRRKIPNAPYISGHQITVPPFKSTLQQMSIV